MGGLQGRCEGTAGRKPILRIHGERLGEERVVARSESRAYRGSDRPRIVRVRPLHGHLVFPSEWTLAGESLENDAAQCIKITARLDLLPADLFR
jgi:hypothetical protein